MSAHNMQNIGSLSSDSWTVDNTERDRTFREISPQINSRTDRPLNLAIHSIHMKTFEIT